jgi:4-diphosphocytidyl-2-C-methyl-D-erythritol kinase
MSTITERAFAKLNLVLAVSPSIKDGKHQLQTVFLTIDLADSLEFSYDEHQPRGVDLEMSWADGGEDHDIPLENNIIYQTIRSFEAQTGQLLNGNLSIQAIKRIPAQGGLGGGSADAAATLRALCTLTGTNLAAAEIHATAAQLGADVPFLLQGGCALMGGAGEILEGTLDVPALDFVLAKPVAGVSTRAAYAVFDADPQPQPSTSPLRYALLSPQPHPKAVAQACANNLYPAALTLLPELANLRTALLEQPGVLNAQLTGSGSVIFGVCETRQAATKAAACLNQQGYWATASSSKS